MLNFLFYFPIYYIIYTLGLDPLTLSA